MPNGVRGNELRQIEALYSVGTFAGLGDGARWSGSRRYRARWPSSPLPRWSGGMGRWSGASAVASSVTNTMHRTRSRPPGWSWCARRARSATRVQWVTGYSEWHLVSRSTPGPRRCGAGSTSGASPRAEPRRLRQRMRTGTTSARCFTKNSGACRNDTDYQSCSAVSKDCRTTRRPCVWADQSELSAVGWLEAGNGSEVAWLAGASSSRPARSPHR